MQNITTKKVSAKTLRNRRRRAKKNNKSAFVKPAFKTLTTEIGHLANQVGAVEGKTLQRSFRRLTTTSKPFIGSKIDADNLAWVAMHVAPESYVGRFPALVNNNKTVLATRKGQFLFSPNAAGTAAAFYLMPQNQFLVSSVTNPTASVLLNTSGFNPNNGSGAIAVGMTGVMNGVTIVDEFRTLACVVEISVASSYNTTSGEIIACLMQTDSNATVTTGGAFTTIKSAALNAPKTWKCPASSLIGPGSKRSLIYLNSDMSNTTFQNPGTFNDYVDYFYILYDNNGSTTGLATIVVDVTYLCEYTLIDANKGVVKGDSAIYDPQAHAISSRINRDFTSAQYKDCDVRSKLGERIMTYLDKGWDALKNDLGKILFI